MRFFEQVFDGRTIISANIEADCWIDAKRRFGYMLSAVQEWLLDEFYKERERAMRGITKI